MSPPVAAATFSVQFDVVDGLAAELRALAGELADEAGLCRATAASLHSSLGGEEGWAAGSAATGWATLAEVVGARAAAVAGTLVRAVTAYRAADLALAAQIGPGRLDAPRGDR
jgi:hypothetical protein